MDEIKSGYTRISSILSILPTLTGINEKYQNIWGFPLQNINQEVLKKKCDIGTNIHHAINCWATHEFAPLNDCERGYFESFIQWQSLVKLKTVQSELRLYDDNLHITGAIDMLGKIEGSENLILIDFKTSASSDDKKWPLQAAFYHHLLTLNKYEVHETILFLQLDKNGEMPKCHTFSIDKKIKTLMVSVYNIYKHLTEK